MKQKNPISVEAPTGVVITTAEAVATRNPIIGVLAVDLNRRFHDDVPQLPYRM
jgi:hypothetical protein